MHNAPPLEIERRDAAGERPALYSAMEVEQMDAPALRAALGSLGLLLPNDVANYRTSGNNPLYINRTSGSATPLNTNYPTSYSYVWQ
jgi:hypothetical protein